MSPPTGIVAFLFTDIEGSTALAQGDPRNFPELLERHNAILWDALKANHGFLFRTVGDAFCVAFDDVDAALSAALQAQQEFQRGKPGPARLKVRMGIHAGPAEPVVSPGGAQDYAGYLTLTRAQRVMAAAYGEQILLSNAAAELLRAEGRQRAVLRDMGEHRLAGLSSPERLWQPIAPGLRPDFPALASLSTIPNNLPAALTSFVSDAPVKQELARLFSEHRLVTLTGPGGVGKTRLALEVAGDLMPGFRHGVWLIELAEVSDPALVPMTIANTLGLAETAGRPIQQALRDYLREKQLLLILDNFEQLVGAAPFVKELLAAASGLKVLVTSRVVLRVAGEHEFPVPQLPLPDGPQSPAPDELMQVASVRLFVERARAVNSRFQLTADNAAAIARICIRLDGLPLAIELAAARTRVLLPDELFRQLENCLNFLTSSARDLPPRQRTLRAAVQWSYDLLTPDEQALFRRLAVFRGGASLDAIQAVCGGPSAPELLDALEVLVESSLLQVRELADANRYLMLETIRDFAGEELQGSGEASHLLNQHLSFFARLADTAASMLIGPNERRWMAELEREYGNLRAAVQYGLERDPEQAAGLLSDLALFWSRGGHNDEAMGWLTAALSQLTLSAPEPAPTDVLARRARVLYTYGMLALQQGRPDAPAAVQESIEQFRHMGDEQYLSLALAFAGFLGDMQAARESVDLARKGRDPAVLALCLIWLSQSARLFARDILLAAQAAAEGANLSRSIGSSWMLARALLSQGQLAAQAGDLPTANASLKESLEQFTASGDSYHANFARGVLAEVQQRLGRRDEALQLYQAAMLAWQDLGVQSNMAPLLEGLSVIAADDQDYQRAIRLVGAAEGLRERSASPWAEDSHPAYNDTLARLRAHIDSSAYQALLAEGAAMTAQEATTYAASFGSTASGAGASSRQ